GDRRIELLLYNTRQRNDEQSAKYCSGPKKIMEHNWRVGTGRPVTDRPTGTRPSGVRSSELRCGMGVLKFTVNCHATKNSLSKDLGQPRCLGRARPARAHLY